jgi:hypothetical protein
MAFNPLAYVGINISSGHRPYTLAAMDAELNLLAISRGEELEVLGYCAGLSSVLVTINAPVRPNIGLMTDPEYCKNLTPPPHPGRRINMRVADYEARLHGVSIPRAPATIEDSPVWMRAGFNLYESLKNLEYQPFPSEASTRQCLESQAETFFYALLGVIPFEANSLEGRIQRQLVLYNRKFPVSDPMDFFEEVTRYRLLHSILPVEKIFSPQELNALAMAYTGWLAINKPETVIRLGVSEEGQITVPILPVIDPSRLASTDVKSRSLKRQF